MRNCVTRENFLLFQHKLDDFVTMEKINDLYKDLTDTVKKAEFTSI